MAWTDPADLRAQVQRLWDKGQLLAGCVQGPSHFPLRLRMAAPASGDLSERFDQVRFWAAALRQGAAHYRLVEREFRHRVVGSHSLPEAAWVDTLEAAVALIGKTRETARFNALVATTRDRRPMLLPWLTKRPLAALALADAWPRLLAVVAWLQAHPRPGIYLRQVDMAGVDSKFIEAHLGVLAELLELALPPEAVDTRFTGASQFNRRYGFRDKPLRIRFRLMDGSAFGSDIVVTQAAFERLDTPVRQVFITENEINFLAFPELPGSLVLFGAGYGFEALARVPWLQRCAVHYWGDIDTHGFAILDQLRATLPHARSLLMDRATLLAHADHWGEEPQPTTRNLPRLHPEEALLFDELRDNRLGPHLRLEQERVGFGWVQQALERIASGASGALNF